MTATVRYQGALRTLATHVASGSTLETDAPTDNAGRGERFSPTDLLATSLAACMCTVMGILAQRHGWPLEGLECSVEKHMTASPRRVGEIRVVITAPVGVAPDAQARAALEAAARSCPVALSLHPDVAQAVRFVWA